MENYEINSETYALLPVKNGRTKIIEKNNIILCNDKPYKIMDDNCKYYGSSYVGRLEAAKKILDCSYKLPIIVEESDNLIFFPTKSSLLNDCCWLNVKSIKKIIDHGKSAVVIFNNNKELTLSITKYSLENQIYRSSKLESIINRRIMAKKKL